MTDYNEKLCNILTDINIFIKDKGVLPSNMSQYKKDKSIMDNLSLELDKLNKKINDEKAKGQNPTPHEISSIKNITASMKIIGNEINNLMKDPESKDDLYNKLLNLNNEIQDESVTIYKKYSNNTDSLISEQNKQYENFKFNKIYLFLFNLGIIFIILRNSYFKKTY